MGGIFVVFAVQKVAPMDWSKIAGAKISVFLMVLPWLGIEASISLRVLFRVPRR